MDTRDARFLRRAVVAPQNLKVNFVVAGVQKGGSTAFHDYLKTHPQICLPPKKEVHFFNTDRYFDRRHVVRYGLRYRYYHSYFKPQSRHHTVGEATPSYMYWEEAPRRMWEYNPEMKLIMVLRDPTARAFSHWNMQRERGIESLPFWEAIQEEGERYRQLLPLQIRSRYAYVSHGFYTDQLRRMWRFFPREQTLLFKSEDLKHQPQEVLRKTYAFLGLEDVPLPQPQTSNVGHYKAGDHAIRMEAKEREYLQQTYEYDIKALERMLNWDCSTWLP